MEVASNHIPFPEEFEVLTTEIRGATINGSKRRHCERPRAPNLPGADEEQMPIAPKLRDPCVPMDVLPDGITSFEQWAFGRFGQDDLCYGELITSEKEEHKSYITWVEKHPKTSKDPRFQDLVAFINAYIASKKVLDRFYPTSSYARRFKKIS